MNASHQVRLHAGATVVGFTYDPAPVIDDGTSGGGSGVSEGPLVLQVPANPAALGVSNQLFALDGDSIIAAIDKTLVAQVENARGADGSPVVLRTRRLADAEFWDVAATDGSDVRPTSGFVRVDTVCQLLGHLALRVPGQPPDDCPQAPGTPAGPGTVIEISPGAVLDFAGLYPVQLPTGVTLRGGRRGLNAGARFCKALDCNEDNPMDAPDGAMLEVTGPDVRITGLRLEGPSRRTDPGVQTTRAVLAHDGPATTRTIVDHNDVSGWTGGGIDVLGPDDNDMTGCTLEPPSFSHVLVARNFLHHNRQQEKGYGVVTGKGGFPFIEGNTFLANRHAIAAAGGGHTGYFARFNLVLSEVPLQDGPGPINWRTHDFDQHGNGDNGFGGRAGLYNWIFNNTFFGANRTNYEIRGHPCRKVDFGRNVSLQGIDDAVVFEPYMILPTQPASEVVNFIANRFDSAHPANRLGVGDFDGDGVDDLFLATGAAWYFSAAGAREWRYLSGNEAPLSFLRFGDVDGDGRTDVLGVSGGRILVSWGGASTFEVLNDAPAAGAFITDFAVGELVSDFPGDRRDDLFYANGASWFVSSGGSSTFVEVNTSSKRIAELRFGDFNGNGLTDVMAIESGVWKVSDDAVSPWTALAVSLTDSVDTLMVADFDADGHADIGTITDRNVPGTFGPTTSVFSWTFSISQGGGTPWVSRTITPTSSCALTFKSSYLAQAGLIAGIGNVDGIAGADVVAWGAKDGNNFCVISGGTGAAARQSSQDMR